MNNNNPKYRWPLNDEQSPNKEVVLGVGQIMQWEAPADTDLVFYEICDPPYQDGRFEDLAE